MNKAHPFSAMLLSALLPGLGQWHNGQMSKAIYLMLAYIFLGPFIFIVINQFTPPTHRLDGLIIWVSFNALIWIYAVVGAGWVAWRGALLQYSWQNGGLYLALLTLAYAVFIPLSTFYVRHYFVESFRVPSDSMEPNIYAGDMLHADKRYNCPGCPTKVQRGDVVIFIYPNDRTQYFIKRVIALPGDQISIKNAEIRINNQSLVKTLQADGDTIMVTEQFGAKHWSVVWRDKPSLSPSVNFKIPAGQILVLGDNRSASNDSRFFGTVPLRDVIGRADFIWMSLDIKTRALHWERIGSAIQ